VSSLPKTVTRQRRGCDLNPGPPAPESSTLTTRLTSHLCVVVKRRAGGAGDVAERGRPVISYRRDSARLTTDE